MGLFTRKSKAPAAPAATRAATLTAGAEEPAVAAALQEPTFTLWGHGTIEFVGLHKYKPQIDTLLKRRGRDTGRGNGEVDMYGTAELLREPESEYDPNAVAIVVDGVTVGHLAKADARKVAPILDQLVARGLTPQTDVRVVRRVPTGGYFGTVTIGPLHELTPANDLPRDAHVLPFDRYGYTISGVKDHQKTLLDLLGGRETASLWGVPHPAVTPRGKLQVSVTVDGKEIGTLGAAPLGDIGETVREWTEAGLVVVAGVRLAAKDETVRANLLVGKPSKS